MARTRDEGLGAVGRSTLCGRRRSPPCCISLRSHRSLRPLRSGACQLGRGRNGRARRASHLHELRLYGWRPLSLPVRGLERLGRRFDRHAEGEESCAEGAAVPERSRELRLRVPRWHRRSVVARRSGLLRSCCATSRVVPEGHDRCACGVLRLPGDVADGRRQLVLPGRVGCERRDDAQARRLGRRDDRRRQLDGALPPLWEDACRLSDGRCVRSRDP